MRLRTTLESWNRRLHFYLGLYFLLFLWLFAVTGLFLNHPNWEFQQYWTDRQESTMDLPLQPVADSDRTRKAERVTSQLGLRGELEWPNAAVKEGELKFRLVKPGETIEVAADFASGVAHIKQTRVNGWGVANMLHTFAGVRITDPSLQRDWIMTKVWSLAMDAVAGGLVFMVFSSYYMWFRLKAKWSLGVIALGAGCAFWGFFAFGLQWM